MKKSGKWIIIIVCLLLVLCIIGAAVLYFTGGKGVFYTLFASVDVSGIMTAESYKADNEVTLNYRLFTPQADAKLPLVLYMHGAGERGEDNLAHVQKNSVMQTLLSKENQEDFPCVVVAPQCPAEGWWVQNNDDNDNIDDTNPSSKVLAKQQPLLYAVHALLEQIQEDYTIDANRIYVTGVSMGGSATWEFLRLYPDYFAAAMPICGWGNIDDVSVLVDVPIWAFHGAKDTTVLPSYSQDMVSAIQDAGGTKVKYTEYPNEYHSSWELAYREAELFPWLFAQKR